MQRLSGKVALVTGSSQGLGCTIAQSLAAAGASVVITDLDMKQIMNTVTNLENLGLKVLGFQMDVTSRDQIEETLDAVISEWGKLDILVNNAGGALHTPYRLEEIEESHWDLVVDVNLKGTFLCCQAAIPLMVKQKEGVIVNISALAGHWRASLAGVQYTAAKAGVEGLTRQLAYDWGPKGIRVNAIAPTITLTGERMKNLWSTKSEEEQAKVIQQIPLRRLAEPTELADVVVYLASDEARYITGTTLDVSGGRYLR
jgi:NAD(P)-dependent dehydrogenase (short-subunit alcohol dehydrogenase family)